MPQRQVTRARGFLSRGTLLSLLVHANLFGPLIVAAWIYGGREEAQRAEEVDVAFEDGSAADLPKDLPPIESPPEPVEAPEKAPKPKPEPRKKPLLARQEQKKKEKDKDKDKEQKKPEPEVMVPPLPPMPAPPPPPPEPRKGHEKMVDLDNGKETPPPPDAKYLAEKNNRADVETRAEDTNLDKAKKGEASPSTPSERHDDQAGGDKQTIADVETEKSLLGRKAPDATPHENPEVAEPKDQIDPSRRSLLALRDPAPRVHELTPETADLSLPRASDGEIPMPERAVRGQKSDPARLPPGKRVKLALTGEDYEYMFGADAEAERRLAQTQRSTKQGKFQKNIARVKAALENFIPEVKPGNTTALNTRAAPFAAFIARMHRSIHRLWGFGALEDWDENSSGSPLNNPSLETTLEMVLNQDGTVDKVTIVRASGYLPYDAAAIDVAYSAGPYPDPPRAIRSGNGKIYVHWRFYRDERQCATSGVDYFILDNAPKRGDEPEGPAVGEPPESTSAPSGGASSHPESSAATPGAAAMPSAAAMPGGAAMPQPLGAAPSGATPLSPTSSTSGSGGLRRLQRFDKATHRGGMQRLDQAVAAAEQSDGTPPPAAPPTSQAPVVRASDPAARAAAGRWFAALGAGEARTLVDMAALPFKTTGKDVTNRADLSTMLSDLAQEGDGARRPSAAEVYTLGGLRAALGKLPPNLDDGSGSQLYAVVASGSHDALILILGQRAGLWKPVGLVRR